MIRFSNGDMFESGAEALVNVPRDANPKIEVNPQSWTQQLLFICEEEH